MVFPENREGFRSAMVLHIKRGKIGETLGPTAGDWASMRKKADIRTPTSNVCISCCSIRLVALSARATTQVLLKSNSSMAELKKCIECQKEIETGAKFCVGCGSHQDCRRHIKTWTPLLGFILAFLAPDPGSSPFPGNAS
ncbi:hypothetical protein OU790_14845, partial [Ruegeria sp. NA]